VTELASTMTPREVAIQAAEAIRALNHLTYGGGELGSPDEVRDIIASLGLMGQGMPQLCEQLARFLVIQQEDGQLEHEEGLDTGDTVTEVIEALAAAGQAADMMTAALAETRAASAQLTPARTRGAQGKRGSDAR
jgi:hypothetical protein